jgi:hypothetical protein
MRALGGSEPDDDRPQALDNLKADVSLIILRAGEKDRALGRQHGPFFHQNFSRAIVQDHRQVKL